MADKLKQEIAECLPRDRRRLRRRLRQTNPADQERMESLRQQVAAARARKTQRTANRPVVDFAMDLPIHARLDDIRTAMQSHQLIVLCGETGSGKTTQLPKLCLDIGRGIDGLIGHTQPRRLAAQAVARRIAEELHTPLGEAVGYQIRHTDVTSEATYIKLMTDGILLAELQRDRQLEKYDTLIIDEAHERSLNIDFILGYLRQLLPRRPDLKVIVTSATIDVDRFSAHFNDAPVIEVSGRSYPVEVRYRLPDKAEAAGDAQRDEDFEQQALLEAIRELSREGQGDMLIFMEGEREIHETAKFLGRQNLKDTDILPLYSRLSSTRQSRIFQPHQRRHIVLATNVAETSLTIPGIHYVIDRGYARISRYNRRSKVQQLPVEKISRASAEQRKGRCGRVADGICIRLYPEQDYAARPEFTDPEIRRTNLASVILQMKALNLGDIHEFPFIDKPDARYINDGLRLLTELQALDQDGQLTRIGRQLARLPLDPRLGRILLAANDLHCVSEIMIIVSALSANDPRERPLDAQQKADAAHARFQDEHSDFLFFLNLWRFYQEQAKKLSQNRLRKLCQQNFISYIRMREWAEVRKQLQELLADMDIHPNRTAADENNIHHAIIQGFLSHIALKTDVREYTGARGIKFNIFPGSGQFTKLPKWIVAAELVETSRLYARTAAAIDPQWLIRAAAHLLQREYSEPYWDARAQQVMAREKISLYGLVLAADQRVNYGRIKPGEARIIFMRQALVEGNYRTNATFFAHNKKIIDEIKSLERKARRHDIFNEEALYDFYERHIPAGIYNGPLFEKWYRAEAKGNPGLLRIDAPEIMYHEAESVTANDYPDALKIGGNRLAIDYKFEPGARDDGVNIDVPLVLLNQVSREQLDYLVPGLFEEKIVFMLKALPKNIRKNLVPVPDTARECAQAIQSGTGSLAGQIAAYLFRSRGVRIPEDAWASIQFPEHLLFNIRVYDEANQVVAKGRDLNALRNSLAKNIQAEFKALDASPLERDDITRWDFGDLPQTVQLEINRTPVTAYPALTDMKDSVAIRVFDTQGKARTSMQQGLRRLFMLESGKDFKYLEKHLPRFGQMSIYYAPVGKSADLKAELIDLIAKQVFLADDPDIRSAQEFSRRREEGVTGLISEANRLCDLVHDILKRFHELKQKLSGIKDAGKSGSVIDIVDHLDHLIYPGFLRHVPMQLLEHYPRYLDAINKRLEKLAYAPARDGKQLERLLPFWNLYKDLMETGKRAGNGHDDIDQFRFLLEEYRVSLFAQELGTATPVSHERIQKLVDKIHTKPVNY